MKSFTAAVKLRSARFGMDFFILVELVKMLGPHISPFDTHVCVCAA